MRGYSVAAYSDAVESPITQSVGVSAPAAPGRLQVSLLGAAGLGAAGAGAAGLLAGALGVALAPFAPGIASIAGWGVDSLLLGELALAAGGRVGDAGALVVSVFAGVSAAFDALSLTARCSAPEPQARAM